MMFRIVRPREPSSAFTWVALGAAVTMYLLDPDRGRRRRSLVRDKIVHLTRVGVQGALRGRWKLLRQARGVRIRVRAKLRPAEPVSDEVLAERTRAKMGVVVTHAHAIKVNVHNGVVTLSGPILRREAKALTRRVKRLDGVHGLVDHLERHSSVNGVPALQGSVPRRKRRASWQGEWRPVLQFVASAAGLGLAGIGFSRRYRSVTAAGAAVFLGSITKMPLDNILESVRRALSREIANRRPPAMAQAGPEPTPFELAERTVRGIRE
jgi:hypothetical protein